MESGSAEAGLEYQVASIKYQDEEESLESGSAEVGLEYQVASIKYQDEEESLESGSPEVGLEYQVASIEYQDTQQSESPEVGKMEGEEVLFEPVEGHTPAPLSRGESHGADAFEEVENMENILTLSPLGVGVRSKEQGEYQVASIRYQDKRNERGLADGLTFEREFALGTEADTGPSTGSGQAVAKACAV